MSQLLPLSHALSGPPAASAAWRWVRLRALLAALLVGGMLITAHPPAASAAATLTASENPVVIPFTVTQEEIIISWNTDNGHEGTVRVAENDGPQSKPFPNGKTGAEKFTVQYGSTYHFTLYDHDANFALLAKLDVTTKRPDFKLETGCQLQCITDVDLVVHGTFADVVVDTNEPAVIVVQASTEAPNPDGTFINKPVAAMTFALSPTTHLDSHLFWFEPGTTYHWMVLAEDAEHRVSYQHGTFLTLQRNVSATFTQICVWDDSDDLSAGDLAFNLAVQAVGTDEWAHKFWPQSDPGDDWAPSGGPCLQPNVTVTLANAPPQVYIWARGFDEDADSDTFSSLACSDFWGAPPYIVCDEGAGADFEYEENEVTIAADALDESDTSDHGFDFVVGEDDGGGLYFSVAGHYKVTYD